MLRRALMGSGFSLAVIVGLAGGCVVSSSETDKSSSRSSQGEADQSGANGQKTSTCVKATEVKNTIGGDSLIPRDINEKGHVAGTASIGGEGVHGFLWDGRTLVDLKTLGGRDSDALALNEDGWVVGYSAPEGGLTSSRATLWRNGEAIDLGTLGGDFSIAGDVNNGGQIVGNSLTTEGETHAFVWENGAMRDLGTLPGHNASVALDINDRGDILGTSRVSGELERHVVLWKDGAMTDLGVGRGDLNERGDILFGSGDSAWLVRGGARMPITPFGDATATFLHNDPLSNAGHVIGTARRPDGSIAPFLWQDGTTTRVGDVDQLNPLSVNRQGEVVGHVGEFGVARAFSWKAGELTYLASADVHTIALGINDAGLIMGQLEGGASMMLWQTHPCEGTPPKKDAGGPSTDDGGGGKTW